MERMTAEQLRALQQSETPKEDKRRVRGAQRTTVDGIAFDSKAEADRWCELSLLQRAGKISGLRRQVEIPLEGRDGPIMTDTGKQQRVYRADFVYVDHALGCQVIEDRKGHATDVFNLKKAILAAQGIEVVLT
ncbi:DUF1064 domain-containing protein [Ruegeria marisrubri]|uniref:DUF1064 domain-containing protein n=1 Tax=Ruegeria marisrubri TaxID=1685379 RepID=UPI001CD4B840|nr:DUF1064 domain-containing protein [Ruegeria marisrubri]MCA0905144.1 DUF1064 domain-containing protein [Ruegeria marisrubri]